MKRLRALNMVDMEARGRRGGLEEETELWIASYCRHGYYCEVDRYVQPCHSAQVDSDLDLGSLDPLILQPCCP